MKGSVHICEVSSCLCEKDANEGMSDDGRMRWGTSLFLCDEGMEGGSMNGFKGRDLGAFICV